MLRKGIKQRVAVILLFAFCIGIWPGAKEGRAAEPVSSDYVWYDEDELILPVYLSDDKEWVDEKGFVYRFDGATGTAQINRINLSYYLGDQYGFIDDAPGDIVLRPPDKVIRDGKTYVVDHIWVNSDCDKIARVHLYIGKYITTVDLSSSDLKVTSYVHYANKKYVSDKGSLFTYDRGELCRFCDETYGPEDTYVLPESVQWIAQGAFRRAEVREVRLNDNIIWIFPYVFQDSYIRRIDLNQVKRIGDGGFKGCGSLEEVIIGEENVEIGAETFSETPALKSMYIPDGCTLGPGVFKGSGIETLVMGKGVCMDEENEGYHMGECHNLKTVIIPEDMSSLPAKAFIYCDSLQKLYIPERVGEIGEECFYRTPVNIYGEPDSAAADVVENNVSFTSLEGHEHNLEKVTFFSFDTWAVIGNYCSECGYAENVKVTYNKNLPAKLVQEEEVYSERCVELNEENTDPDGIVYELDPDTMTAVVKDVNTGGTHSGEFSKGIVVVPAKVTKDEKQYVVETMGYEAFNEGAASTVVLPDTVKRLEGRCFGSTVKKIVLGSKTEEIDEEAFADISELECIELRGENPYFTVKGNALYNKDKTELIRVTSCGAGTAAEFTVPDTVSRISRYAFVQNRWRWDFWLLRIRIPDRTRTGQPDYDTNRWFVDCYASIQYMDEKPYKVDAPLWLPDFIKPEASPNVTPDISPTVKPISSPDVTPVDPSQSPLVSPLIEPTEVPGPVLPDEGFQASPAVMPDGITPVSGNSLAKGLARYRQELGVGGVRGHVTSEGYVKLTWQRNISAKCYRIYRASSENGTYKLIRMISKAHLTCTDKNVRENKKYFYKVTAMGVFENKAVEGEESGVFPVRISGLRIPEISVKKGKLEKVRYITVIFRRYAGKNADIYISLGKQRKFKKLKLVSSKIARYKGKFKIRYMVKKQEIRIKVRTYKKEGKRKVYSRFSRVVSVKV